MDKPLCPGITAKGVPCSNAAAHIAGTVLIENDLSTAILADNGQLLLLCAPHRDKLSRQGWLKISPERMDAMMSKIMGGTPPQQVGKSVQVSSSKEETMRHLVQNKIWYYVYQVRQKDQTGQVMILEDGESQVMTNDPKPRTRALLEDAIATRRPVQWAQDRWMAPVTLGEGFHMPFLERLDAAGVKFTLEVKSIADAREIWGANYNGDDVTLGEHWAASANLAWVTAGSVFLFRIHGIPAGQQFDWSLIGLTVKDSKKMPKRISEVTRIVKAVKRGHLRVKKISPAGPVELYDGKSAIKRSALPKEVRHLNHVMGRGSVAGATIKGDFVVVDDRDWIHDKVDVVIHPENEKSEVGFAHWAREKVITENGRIITINGDLWTFWPHDPLHNVIWDHQTQVNYPTIYQIRDMEADLNAMVGHFHVELKAGRLPSSHSVTESDAHEEGALPVDKAEQEMALHHQLVKRMMDAGISPKSSIALVYLSFMGLVNSMKSNMHPIDPDGGVIDPKAGLHRRHKVIRRNAFRATVVTSEFLKHFAGIEMDMKGCDVIFDSRWGSVWTGDAFVKRFVLHGGYDLDDTLEFYPIKVWSDDPSTVARLRKDGVLTNSIRIPSREEDAIMVMFTTRLPNGVGEYSVNTFDFGSWPKEIAMDPTLIRTHNMSFKHGWPKPQPMVMPTTTTGLITSRVYSKTAYTRADFAQDLKAQYINPSFGTMCNVLLFFGHVTGGHIPMSMPSMLGDIVDATQQGADVATFKQIATLPMQIAAELGKIAAQKSLRADRHVRAFRGAAFKKVNMRETTNGLFSIEAPYKKAYEDLEISAKTEYSFFMRNDDPTVKKIRKMVFSDRELAYAKAFIQSTMVKLDEARTSAQEYIEPFQWSAFIKSVYAAYLRDLNREIIDDAIAKINASKNPNRFALAIWHAILKPGYMSPTAKHGSDDRILTMMGTDEAIMDCIIRALTPDQDSTPIAIVENGPTHVVLTNSKLDMGAIQATKVIPLKAERRAQTCDEVMEVVKDRIAEGTKFVWILDGNFPLAAFRLQDGNYIKTDRNLPADVAIIIK